jgi:hypothetical protein
MLHRPAVGISPRLWTAEGTRDLHEVGIPPVIHFSTASPVHSYAVIDQQVYPNHPQRYAQDVSLGRPGAGLIGACSHAGPGSYAAVDPPAIAAVTAAVRPHQADHSPVSFIHVQHRNSFVPHATSGQGQPRGDNRKTPPALPKPSVKRWKGDGPAPRGAGDHDAKPSPSTPATRSKTASLGLASLTPNLRL